MAYFKKAEFKRVTLPSDSKYWVDIKTNLRWDEVKHFLEVAKEDGSVNPVASADVVLAQVITAWNLDDAEGNIVEITQENINKLASEDAIEILNHANLDTDAKEASKKN